MSLVVADVSVSVDGFSAGPDVSVRDPMGVGGERLHRWLWEATADPVDAVIARSMSDSVGAVVVGRTTYEVGKDHWDGTPFPAPTFVVTHQPQADIATGTGTFHFVTDGVAAAVAHAREAAGDRTVAVMGASATQQAIATGVLDELHLHIVPVLLGDGVRLLEGLGTEHLELDRLEVSTSRAAMHVRYHLRARSHPSS